MQTLAGPALVALATLLFASLVHAQTAESPRFAVHGFTIEGELPIPADAAQRVLAAHTGNAVGLDELRAAAKALEALLSERGYAFYRVTLPPQTIEATVRLLVLPFKLAQVTVEGNQHFSTENILAGLPTLKPGESPNVAAVARNRAHVNEHPSKQVEVTFRQSRAPDAVDADVRVQDSQPARVYVSAQNTGDQPTGRWRTSVGIQHGNLFGRDHQLSASYTTSPDHLHDVQQYGAFYTVPFYTAGGSLTGFATRSKVDSGTIAGAFNVSGRGEFLGMRWRQHLDPQGAYSHAIEAGVEDRFFDNSVLFGPSQIGVDVRTRPLTLGYQGRWDGVGAVLRGTLDHARNLGGGSDNDDSAYAANRAGATTHWSAWRYSLEGSTLAGGWTLTARLRGQHSGDALVPGEQFALGGAGWVRGLAEREGTGDKGHVINFEALTPPLAEGLRLLLFADAGATRNNLAGALPARQGAASAGLGVRYQWRSSLSVSMDLASVLNGAGNTSSHSHKLHVALAYRF